MAVGRAMGLIRGQRRAGALPLVAEGLRATHAHARARAGHTSKKSL
jgi:hypothetical protein